MNLVNISPVRDVTVPEYDTNQALLKVAMLLLEGLSHNVMSKDVWWHSAHSAKHRASSLGVSREEFENNYSKLMVAIESNRSKNTLASMF